MRKLFIFIAAAFLIGNLQAQLNGYMFSTSTGTYTEITGGVVLGNTTTDDQRFVDPSIPLGGTTTTGVGLPIGFNFEFSGSTYDVFAVNANGWISLGTTTNTPAVNISSTSSYTPLGSTAVISPDVLVARIALFGRDLNSQTGGEIRYETIGTAPNRVLVVQWANYRKYNATGDSYNGQIRLYETTNAVQLVYGTMTNNATSTTVHSGLRGAPSATASNFASRTTTTDWANTTASLTATGNLTLSNAVFPSSGLTFTWTIPTCWAPTALTVTNITTTTADLGWTSTVGLYDVEAGLPGFTPGTGTAVSWIHGTNANMYQAWALTPATTYEFYVRADCGGGDLSIWAGPFAFTTSCIDVTDFFENFDGVATPTLPVCWNKVTALGTVQTQTANNFSAPNCLYMYSSSLANTAVVSMPPVSNLQAETHRLRFMGRGNFSANAIVEVGYLTNPIDPLTFVLISSVTLTTTTYAEYVVEPTGIPAGVTALAFRTTGTPTFSLLIDDVYWEVIPSCLTPTALTVTGITATTADLGWTSSAALWNVEVGLTGFTPGTGDYDFSVTGTTNNPWTAIGLSASTSYEFYVQADCGGGDLSIWAGPIAFTTACNPYTAPFTETFDSGVIPACWTNTSSNPVANGLWKFSGTPDYGAIPNGKPAGTYAWADGSTPVVSDVTLISPAINLATLTTPELSFEWFSNNTNNPGDNTSLIIDIFNGTIWQNLDTLFGDNPSWLTEYYDLSAYAGQTIQIRFINDQTTATTAFYNDILLDNVVVDEAITCAEPTALSVANITQSTADLSWTSTVGLYDVEAGLPGFTPGTGTAASWIYGTTLNMYQAWALTPATTYEFYVRADCGGGDLSAWAGPFSFTTECSVISTLPYSESFDLTTWPLCWTQTYEGALTSNRWNVNATSNAGGTANEMRCSFQNAIGISRLIAPIIDLSLAVNPVLEFNHFFDDFGAGATMKIQTSADGITWVDEAFSFVSGGGNVGPVTVTVPLTTLSATTYIAWVVDGNHFQIDYWYIDNVVIKEPLPATINPVAADYDLTFPADVATTVTWNDASSITTIVDDQIVPVTLIENTHYTVVGNTLTILDAYLSNVLLSVTDVVVLTITFDLGVETFTITAIESPLPPVVVAHWDFEDAAKRALITNNATFISNPYTADNGIAANVDIAPITLVDGALFSGWVQGYLAAGSAPNSNTWDVSTTTKYWMITVSTFGYENLKLSSKQFGSATGPRDFEIEYSTDGLLWTPVVGSSITVGNNWTSGVLDEVELPFACNNQSSLLIRWIPVSTVAVGGGAIGSGGTNRIDEILITGTDVTVSIPEITSDVKVYPNPSNGQFVIETDNNWTMMVYDITGRIVASQQITKGSNDINLLGQPSGLYMVRLFNKEQTQTIRIVIE